MKTPGEFVLDGATLATYEGFCRPTYRIDFQFGALYVSTHVAVSDDADERTVERMLAVLNSVR